MTRQTWHRKQQVSGQVTISLYSRLERRAAMSDASESKVNDQPINQSPHLSTLYCTVLHYRTAVQSGVYGT